VHLVCVVNIKIEFCRFTDDEIWFYKFTWKYSACCTFAKSAHQTQFTVLRECTNLALLASSLHSEHMLEPVMTLKGLLNFLERMT